MNRRTPSQGYAFVTSMIVLAVISALVIGFIQQVNTEQKIGRNDLDYAAAFYAAEAGLEKLNSDLSKEFQQSVFPTASMLASIQGAAYRPGLAGASYTTYSIIGGQSTRLTGSIAAAGSVSTVLVTSAADWPTTGFFMIDGEEFTYAGTTATSFTGVSRAQTGSIAAAHNVNATVSRSKTLTIAEGPQAGLTAQTIPFTLEIVARAGAGAEAKLTREVQVALIPVFQFGVFSDSDLSFFAGPNFDFGGRVHSNSTLYLAEGDGNTLTLAQKVTTASEVIRTNLSNGQAITVAHNGTVNMMKTPGTYRALASNEGSLTGAPGSSANSNWPTLSLTTYNGNILSRRTGGKPLTLPFAGGSASPIEIIKRPCFVVTGPCIVIEDPNSILGQSRLVNQASLRVFLSDSVAGFPAGTGYPLSAALKTAPYNYTPGAIPFRPDFAQADPADPDFLKADNTDETANGELIDGFIKIEMQKSADNSWSDVTMEVLNLGIAQNQPDAILRFQRLKPLAGAGSTVATDYWPINMFDVREGRFRDSAVAGGVPKIGIMNIVELNVDNLRKWFAGAIGTTGNQALSNNGYIFYYSDRRGNRDPSGWETGELGFEDVVNPGDVTNGLPDGVLQTGEDLNGNSALQTYGANLPYSPFVAGADLYSTVVGPSRTIVLNETLTATDTTIDVAANPSAWPASGYFAVDSEMISYTGRTTVSPFRFTGCVRGAYNTTAATHSNGATISIRQKAMKNRQHYFRRALRLVNGVAPNLPAPGFTVAAENPVYVQGSYNANGNWTSSTSAAAIIADMVTFLSSNWTDERSFEIPYAVGSRKATTEWYRVAIAAGKGRTFPRPGTTTPNDFGTDGGVHNFLRYLENWGGQTLNYKGSIVSLYFARQSIGAYKCCSIVYSPPARAYSFDTNFLVPSQLPPGTPRFRDINNLSFRQTIRSDH